LKILVMGTKAAGEFPDPFNWVEIWAVRGQEEKYQCVLVAVKPVAEKFRVMISRVVQNKHDLSPPPRVADNHFEEVEKCLRVEDRSLTGHHEAVRGPNHPKECDAFPGRGMEDDGVFFFRRDPHNAPRPVLLKVALVFKPQVHLITSRDLPQFF